MLHTLQRHSGIKRKMLRLGRGNSSGKGNYSTKGCKGQKSRSGYSLIASFEGGQTPLIKQMKKKRGFKRYFKLLSSVVSLNLSQIEANGLIVSGNTYSYDDFCALGIVSRGDGLKILGQGSMEKKITFLGEDISFSQSAREKILATGSSIA